MLALVHHWQDLVPAGIRPPKAYVSGSVLHPDVVGADEGVEPTGESAPRTHMIRSVPIAASACVQ